MSARFADEPSTPRRFRDEYDPPEERTRFMDHRGEPVYPEDVLSLEELAEDYRRRGWER